VNDVPYEFVQAGGYFGPTFTGVFFFENVFWRMVIPLVFDVNVRVKVIDGLVAMPAHLRRRLVDSELACEAYKLHWADCIDYDQGRNYFFMQSRVNPAADLVTSLDRDLRSTIADLSQGQPNSNAMHNARMATEKALKAFLCFRYSYTVEGVRKKFQHDIAALAAEVVARDPNYELKQLQPEVQGFAPYSDRYANKRYSRPELWSAYRSAQFAASSLMRLLTPYNQRAAMADLQAPSNNQPPLPQP
jgi:hypothetical protein